jgi:hypothetical protein
MMPLPATDSTDRVADALFQTLRGGRYLDEL